MTTRTIAVLGGAGYIGSHTVIEALRVSWNVLVIDDYRNMEPGSRQSTFSTNPLFRRYIESGKLKETVLDIRQTERLVQELQSFVQEAHAPIDAVILLAASIDVAQSVSHPDNYYDNNLQTLLSTVKAMLALNVRNIVFSSTAAVYGSLQQACAPPSSTFSEDSPINPASPYGRSKHMCETILSDCCHALPLSSIVFRFFNAAGADSSAQLGLRKDNPSHLIPRCLRLVQSHTESSIRVYGTDYPTIDGTGVRDFVHVSDIARAILLAVEHLVSSSTVDKFDVINLGTQQGSSVRQVIDAVRNVTQSGIVGLPSVDCPRRPGDLAQAVASRDKARRVLGWTPEHDLLSIIRSDWNYLQNRFV